MANTNHAWWHGAVIYEIYIRSFFDSNGDGIGDLKGITQKLDYLASLPIDAIWITPFFKSPMRDFGYDISDYTEVDPIFGTVDDFRELIEEAHLRDLRVIIDQVWSHTSDQHEWFLESQTDRYHPKHDWYVWADGDDTREDKLPNNWLSIFGGTAWKWNETCQQYYLHNFLESQPDLNWHNSEVLREIMNVAEFWLETGVDGFRLDACNYYLHDPSLLDNPRRTKGMPIQDGVSPLNPYSQFINLHNMNQVRNIKSLRRIRSTIDKFPGTIALGEIVVGDDTMRQTVEYIRGENRLHTAYNSSLLVDEPLTPKLVASTQEELSLHLEEDEEEMICLTMSNHDFPRATTRWAPSDPSLSPAFDRMLVTLLPTLRGMICFYHGEELGLTETDIPKDEMQDPFGIHFHEYFAGRDGCRTPIPWDSTKKNFGFTDAEKPWLRMDPNFKGLGVQDQEDDPDSLLNYFRRFLKWRNRQPALKYGDFDQIEVGTQILSFIRKVAGQRLLCVFNFAEQSNFYLVSCRYGHPLMSNGITSFRVTNLGNGDRTIEMEPFGFAIFEREF